MISEVLKLQKLTADDGMTLTNGSEFGKVIFLGAKDCADNWREISDDDAEKLRQELIKDGEEEKDDA